MAKESSSKIRVNNFNVFYGEKHALNGISLEVQLHKVTAFIGPSGCGKSTLLKALNRIGELEGTVKVSSM